MKFSLSGVAVNIWHQAAIKGTNVCKCMWVLVRQRMNLNHSPFVEIKDSRSNTGSHPHSPARLPKSQAIHGPGNLFCRCKGYMTSSVLPQHYKISMTCPRNRGSQHPKQEQVFELWPRTSCCELPNYENMTSQ